MTSLASIFNHLVLPPKLPGQQDADIQQVSDDILRRLIKATATLSKLDGQKQALTWRDLDRSLRCCQFLHASGRLEKQSLIPALQNLKHHESLILHILEQNAALIIRLDVR